MRRNMIILFMLSLAFILPAEGVSRKEVSLQGTVVDKNKEPVTGVTIYFPELKTGAVTDLNGHYNISSLPEKTLMVQVSSLGYKMIAEDVPLATVSHKDFTLEESVVEINEVAVTGQAVATQSIKTPTPITVVSSKDLAQHSATNIIDAISNQPGISQITTGSGISKPVIRGLGYNRVVVMNDGVRQEGQQWGDEHGIEIDEYDVNRVEILKGPASLMYGSDAMAGVVNFIPAPIQPQGTQVLNLLGNYQTNNGLRAYSLNYAGHLKSFVWDLRYSNKAAHSYQNKYDGYVYNTGFAENSASALLGLNKWWGYSHLTLSAYQLTPGIPEGERDEVTGQFIKPAIDQNGDETETVATNSDFLSYKHQMPYQQVKHYKAILNNNFVMGDGFLKVTLGWQQNNRQEFEDILEPDQYGLYFKQNTVNYDVHYLLPETGKWSFSLGTNGMYQHSQNLGTEFLIPEFQLFDFGMFAMVKRSWDKFDFSGGLRFDNRSQSVKSLYLDENENVTTASDPTAEEKFGAFSRNFSGVSGSVGVSYNPTQTWNMKLNLSKGFRAPNVSELSSNGVHEGTLRYELGNENLKPESSLQLDYEIGYNSDHVSARLNLFANMIDHYIYIHKLPSVNGGDSIREDVPVYTYQQGKAMLTGGEFTLDIHPHPLDWLHFENSFSYVNSQLMNQTDSTKYLPFTPAPKWRSELRVEFDKVSKQFSNVFASVGVDHYFAQNHIFSAYDTETATPAYTLLGAAVGTDLQLGKQKFTLVLNGENLTDVAYQSHLSRLKYAAVNNATGRTGVYNMGRNVSLKLIVPITL